MRLIDAEALENDIAQHWGEFYPKDGAVIERIHFAPTVDVEIVKRGRWEMKLDPFGFFDEIPVCSECGCTTVMRKTHKFCPNCGAKMYEVENEID